MLQRKLAEPPEEQGARGAGVLVWVVVGTIIAVAVAALYRPPYLVVSPSTAIAIRDDIRIDGAPVDDLDGRYLITTVSLSRRSALGTLWSALRGDREVVALSHLYPRGVRPAEYARIERQAFGKSRQIAAAAAARAIGMPVTITGSGARGRRGRRGFPRRRCHTGRRRRRRSGPRGDRYRRAAGRGGPHPTGGQRTGRGGRARRQFIDGLVGRQHRTGCRQGGDHRFLRRPCAHQHDALHRCRCQPRCRLGGGALRGDLGRARVGRDGGGPETRRPARRGPPPTAQAAAVLPDGRVFYYNGLESWENAQHSTFTSAAPSSRDSQARILDLRSGTPEFTVPTPPNGGQPNPNIRDGQRSPDDPTGIDGIPGRPGDGLVGSTWGSLGGPAHDPTAPGIP